jgi:DNA-directed RNA polymerase subunit RPC12/RpoP
MTRLKTKSEFEKIQCPKCGSKKTVLHTGIVSLYLKFACGECGYKVEVNPKAGYGVELQQTDTEWRSVLNGEIIT